MLKSGHAAKGTTPLDDMNGVRAYPASQKSIFYLPQACLNSKPGPP